MAEALHHAHKQGLVHRDIKPGNILLDTSGKPFVADFGLALREEDVGKGPRFAGTPAYMSPEQARGEGHRVDGRTDIFSLGVVFYELLTGRRPFRADSQDELLEQITSVEARPPRQMRRHHPEGTGTHLPEGPVEAGLGALHDGQGPGRRPAALPGRVRPPEEKSAVTGRDRHEPDVGHAAAQPGADPPPTSRPIKIVPKGLRSFDAHDADFFLELLPGPRDRDGLPDSIRFWKTRIEETDAGQHLLRRPDLRAVRLRQVVAGEGGAAAPAGRRT